MISSDLPSPSAHCTAASMSLRSRGLIVSSIGIAGSEPWNIGKRHAAAADMHAAEVGAVMGCRGHRAGLEQSLLVEGAFDALLVLHVDFGEHNRHQVALLDPDAMLAGEHAADLDAKLENVGPERLRALQFPRLIGIVKDQRMEIAVTGMEHVGDAKAVMM